ncbi:unnamed protein product [Rotaria sordida]|uniref:Uncharacterized protein n=1 Tax=Rotaria sordida TaxID=392033 RepID=A0A820MK32_9BILA|nr:unnamed protein product [Rotaria sordida]
MMNFIENQFLFFFSIIFSIDQNILLQRNKELKNKLREQLKEELRRISGAIDASSSNTDKILRKTATTDKTKSVDEPDYFELVYECIHTHKTFLNIISLNARNPIEPDIDLVILQALLNG